MPFNGSGTFTLTSGIPVTTGSVISSTMFNTFTSDLANNGLSNVLCKDGQTTVTANLPMAGFRHTGVGNATTRLAGTYASAADVQDGTLVNLTSVAGTNTITATGAISMTAYASGQCFRFIPANTNTGAATLNINSIGAKNIFANGAALIGNEIVASVPVTVIYDGTQFHISGPLTQSNGSPTWVAGGGTADAITATYSPAIVTLVDGLTLRFRATAANATTTPTFAPNGLTAHTITKKGGGAVVVGDIAGNLTECIVTYNLANTRWELLNPTNTFGTQTANTFLGGPTSGGAATPTFRTLVGIEAGLTLLTTGSANNSATLDFTSIFSSTYQRYWIYLANYVPATDNTEIWVRLGISGTFQSAATDYVWQLIRAIDAGAPGTAGSTGDSKIVIAQAVSNAAGRIYAGTIEFSDASSTTKDKMLGVKSVYIPTVATGSIVTNSGGGFFATNQNAITDIRFMSSSGNMTTLDVAIFGERKS